MAQVDPERLPPPNKGEGDSDKLLQDTYREITDNFNRVTRRTSTARIERYIDAVSTQAESLDPYAKKCIDACKPCIVLAIKGLMFLVPFYKSVYSFLLVIYLRLPKNIAKMVLGAILCFFGGKYVVTIAAIEAFRTMGWQRAYADLMVCYEQGKLVASASAKDDKVDADGDGVADVDDITAAEFAQRKITLAMTTIKEPQKLQTAVGSLWAAYLAVLATLRMEFARTTALALAMVEMVEVPITKAIAPALVGALGSELKHWAKTIIHTTLAVFAIIFAWILQKIISAFYTGLRGGRMFSQGLVDLLNEKGLMEKIPFIKKPFDPDDSVIDDLVGYVIAAAGFTYQVVNWFTVPFFIEIFLYPLDILELFLMWQVSTGATPSGPV